MNDRVRIVPTVGRVIHFYLNARHYYDCVPSPDNALPSQPFRADICYVQPDGSINVSVNTHEGSIFPKRGVPIIEEGDQIPEAGPFCRWMDYQKGQAVKHERVDATVKAAYDGFSERVGKLEEELATLKSEAKSKND